MYGSRPVLFGSVPHYYLHVNIRGSLVRGWCLCISRWHESSFERFAKSIINKMGTK